ncbi:MAG: Gfo/Idh/MocA family oxidoreductase [Actinomycetota bacterium]|nr:Gfo/Idh/MocA family oxidoreductase [Actinomycetota bacterium]
MTIQSKGQAWQQIANTKGIIDLPMRIDSLNVGIISNSSDRSLSYFWRSLLSDVQSITTVERFSNSLSFDLLIAIDAQTLSDAEIAEISSANIPSVIFHFTEDGRFTVNQRELILCDLGNGEWFLKGPSSETPIFCRPLSITGEVQSIFTISKGLTDLTIAGSIDDLKFVAFSSIDLKTIDRRARNLLRENFLPFRSRSSNPVRVAIAGYGPFGGMGHYHGSAIEATDGLELVAIADPSDDRQRSAKVQFPQVATFATVQKMLTESEFELIIIATPPSTHFELAKASLDEGKHVVVEKPMCLTVEEVDELQDIALSKGLSLTVHQNRRYDPDFLMLREIIESGEVGEVFNIETTVGTFEHPCRAWHSDESISGGAAYDWGSHHIDWILQLYGESPTEIFATSHKRVWHDVTNVDQMKIEMIFADGREATFIQSEISAHRKPKFYVQGTKGTIVGWYQPIVDKQISFPFGYQESHHHFAEAPVDLEVAKYIGDNRIVTQKYRPKFSEPFEFHRNIAAHLQFGEEIEVKLSQVRRVIGVLEESQRISTSKEHFYKF